MSKNIHLSSLLSGELSAPASNQRSLSVLSSRETPRRVGSPAIPSISSQSESTVPGDEDEQKGDPLEWPARKERKSWVWLPINGKDVWHEKINGWKWHCVQCMKMMTSVLEINKLISGRSRAKKCFIYRRVNQEYDKPSCPLSWFQS